MAKTKLKNLKVTKVDFVDAGANPNANVVLYKSKDGIPTTQQGIQTESVEAKPEGMFKKFISAIGKAVGLKQEEIDATIEEIAKGSEAETFGEKMNEVKRRKITDEMWDLCYALESSLCSIICDDEAGDKSELMKTSLEEFMSVMNSAIEQWADGKTSNVIQKSSEPATETELNYMKSVHEKLQGMITKAESGNGSSGTDESEDLGESKGEEVDMSKVNKSKMTPAERAFFEDIEKRYSEGEKTGEGTEEQDNPVVKSTQVATPQPVATENTTTEDIYKGLHPAVKEELERLKKRADEAEEKELTDIAKKYEIIGKKPEELVPLLKNLKIAGGDSFGNMVAILDASVEAVNKSSMFSEIGKSGGYGGTELGAWAKIEKKADEIQQAKPELSRAAAIDTACQQNPQLVHEYENE